MTNTLTPHSAGQLFKLFVEQPQLTWNHINTGCESRADLMAEIAAEKGLKPSKIWIEISPGSEGLFSMYLNEAKTEFAYCEYHVAIVLSVNIESATEAMIFDPAFFAAPVSRSTWIKRLSSRVDEYGYQALISDSDWRNFFGPVQMIYVREKALKKRAKILARSRNFDDGMISNGVFSSARGKWVDSLYRNDPSGFEELQSICSDRNFTMWFKGAEKKDTLKQWLQNNPHYFGLPSAQLLEAIDFSDRMAALEVRKRYWRYMRDLFLLLTRKRDDLLSGTGSPSAANLSASFRMWWGSEAEENAEAEAKWYGAASSELWDEFGLDYRILQD